MWPGFWSPQHPRPHRHTTFLATPNSHGSASAVGSCGGAPGRSTRGTSSAVRAVSSGDVALGAGGAGCGGRHAATWAPCLADIQPVGRGGGSATFLSADSGKLKHAPRPCIAPEPIPGVSAWYAAALLSFHPRAHDSAQSGCAVGMQPVGRRGGSAVILSGDSSQWTTETCPAPLHCP